MAVDQELPGGVDLAEAVEALRSQLGRAMDGAPARGLRFRPGPVELTVQAALTKGMGGNAGIRWWLIQAGGDISRQSVVTQTLKISLQPVVVNDEGKVVDALISGVEDPSGSGSGQPRYPAGAAE